MARSAPCSWPTASCRRAGRTSATAPTPETLDQVAAGAGLDGAALRAREDEAKAAYGAYTQEAIERQVFGAPSYVLNGEIFWGQDRLDFVERALTR